MLNFLKMEDQNYSVECLQVAGVPCEGNPHFWVSEDGSIQEEGQNNMRDRIWDKVCSLDMCITALVLPIAS